MSALERGALLRLNIHIYSMCHALWDHCNSMTASVKTRIKDTAQLRVHLLVIKSLLCKGRADTVFNRSSENRKTAVCVNNSKKEAAGY